MPLSETMLEYFNWTLGDKLQWNFYGNQYVFIQENAFENVICKMVTILSQSENASGQARNSLRQWKAKIGSGNGLVPDGTKPLPEPMLTKIADAKWHH